MIRNHLYNPLSRDRALQRQRVASAVASPTTGGFSALRRKRITAHPAYFDNSFDKYNYTLRVF
jgi:hypothetical protein